MTALATIGRDPALLRTVRAELARRSFDHFIRKTSPGLPPPAHLKPVIDLWQQTAERQVFGVIELPPRHAKTTTAMHALAWHVLRSPEKTSAYATYAQTLARSKSRTIRNLALEAGATLADDMANLDEWRTKKGGGLLATGVGGPLTGQGITGVAVVDDALKNREDATSQTIRDDIWDWFRDVVWTRLEEQASVIVMATRWHEDDLIGRLLAQGVEGVPFTRVRLPAVAEVDDPLGREVGAALWPDRFPVEKLAEIEKLIGSYSWASLYQQRPAPIGGGIFRRQWFGRYESLPAELEDILLSVDCAAKKTTDGSNTAILALARKGPHRYVLDNETGHFTTSETVAKILAMRMRVGAKRVLVEEKAAGPSVIEELQTKVPGVLPINPGADTKESRAMAIQAEVEGGGVLLPAGAPWVEAFLHEVCSFPAGARDDQVDAMTQALNYWRVSPGAMRLAMRSVW